MGKILDNSYIKNNLVDSNLISFMTEEGEYILDILILKDRNIWIFICIDVSIISFGDTYEHGMDNLSIKIKEKYDDYKVGKKDLFTDSKFNYMRRFL